MLSPNDFAQLHLQKLQNYLTGITANTIGAGRLEQLGVERFLMLKEKHIYKEESLIRVLKFFSLINIPIQGKVKQVELLDYMVFWLANVYGLYENESKRLFNTAYIELSKKNSKTTTWALAGIYESLFDGELNANCIYVASSKDQAKIALSIVEDAIKNSPALKKKFKANRNIITNKTSTGKNVIQVKSAEVKTIQGFNSSYGLADEYAQWDTSEIADKITSGMAARKNPLTVLITTAANNLQSPAYAMREMCVNILEESIEMDNVFTQIFALDDKSEIDLIPAQPQLLRKCNPGLGECVSVDFLLSEYRLAKVLKDKWNTYLTDNLNFWTDNNIGQEVFIDDDTVVGMMTHEKIPEGQQIQTYFGVDIARNKDLNSISEMYYNDQTGVFLFDIHTIFPNNERNKIRDNGSINLSRWFITPDNPDGYIHTSTIPVLDEEILIKLFQEFKEKRTIRRVGFDPYLASQIMYKLQKQLNLNCINIKQNWTLTQPISFFERLVYLNKIRIVNNPVVRWNFQNCAVQQSKGTNATLHLVKKNKEAIDNVVSMVVALATWMVDHQDKYNDVMSMFDELQAIKKTA